MAPEGWLDYVILAVPSVALLAGMVRGMAAGAIALAALAASWVTAVLLTPAAAAWLESRFHIDRWAADLAGRHLDWAGETPALPGAAGSGSADGLLHPLNEMFQAFWPALPETAAGGFIERAAGTIIYGLLFFLLFLLAHQLFRLAGRVLKKTVGSIPVISFLDKVLGAFFGLAVGLIIVTAGVGVAAVLYFSFGWDFLGRGIISSAYAKQLLTVFSALTPFGPGGGR